MTRNQENGRDLIVVIPVYNEEASIWQVVQEWHAALAKLHINFGLLIINDGSTDGTRTELAKLTEQYATIDVIEKANSGHGQSCITGYREAIACRAKWVFQIDSDGQCDPRYFPACWQLREQFPAIFGQRVHRNDGIFRVLISAINRLAVWLATGVYVPDSNVPYRLMRWDVLETAVHNFPADFYLANILLAVILQKGLGNRMKHLPIGFRQRNGGEASVRWGRFVTLGWQLFRALQQQRYHIQQKARQLTAVSRTPHRLTRVFRRVSP